MLFSAYRSLLLLMLIAVACPLAMAQDSTVKDEVAIRGTALAYQEAFESGDAKALAALWAETGQYIDESGNVFDGRDAIEEEFTSFFAGAVKGRRLDIRITSLRFPAANVAIEDGIATVIRPIGPSSQGRYTAVHAKAADGTWYLDSVRETVPLRVSHYEYLKDLAWMEGDFAATTEKGKITISGKWSENSNFLLRKFTFVQEGFEPMIVSQRIGYDPLAKQVKSWVFDSEGGYAQGRWSRNGDTWTVKAMGVSNDGSVASSTNTLTVVDEDSFTWQSRGRILAGQPSEDVGPVTIRRVK